MSYSENQQYKHFSQLERTAVYFEVFFYGTVGHKLFVVVTVNRQQFRWLVSQARVKPAVQVIACKTNVSLAGR